ncbi:MAG TPA: glucosamine-6-phosphate deaminase [Bacteroidales bacterium]|nr:glucosamine-6-phosphate deaminase [Bacteroidales bacterium]HBZ21081.1 glucosamine-6-phosphate deaminase [Bacteroidales bacterium]
MNISISENASELGSKAAEMVSVSLNEAVSRNGEARIVVSTGSSQFEMFQALVKEKVDWTKVTVFHLDEYIGLQVTHKASFRKYLYDRFISLVPVRKFFSVDVEGNIKRGIEELTSALREKPVDLGLIGIGVNGHIAFNDPPADFDTTDAYIIVRLNDQCKYQQVNEGWFEKKGDVPDEAVSMSVWQIMQCRKIISVVPHIVKADAVRKTLSSKVTSEVPATILKRHPDWHLFLDRNSAAGVITL